MKVRYIGDTDELLTKGKKYKVLADMYNSYQLIDNNGYTNNYSKNYFEIVKSKQLKVGDVLLAKDLNDWCKAGKNYYTGVWGNSIGSFFGDRTIKEIEIKDGHKAFLISNTNGAWIKAKGFRKFCKR